MPNFLPHGCLCIDDIYDEDREFFDAVVEFVNAGHCQGSVNVASNPVIGNIISDKHPQINGVSTSCPSPLPTNGFTKTGADGTPVSLDKDEMMNKVLNMPAKVPPAPPALPDAVAMSEIVVDIHLYNFDADGLNTLGKRTALENHIASQLAASSSTADHTADGYDTFADSAIKVEIQYFARGGVIPDTEDENTVITIKIKPAAGRAAHRRAGTPSVVLLKWATERPKDLGSAGPSCTATSRCPVMTTNLTFVSFPTGTAPAAVTPRPATLPPAATGLPRQGINGTYEGGLSSPKGTTSCRSWARPCPASPWRSSWSW